MPEASLPPMWKPVVSPSRSRALMTFTGTPRAAQTLLKLIPAAITHTSASFGFRPAGTSTFSIWNACAGSPKRSGRITWAYICFGTAPMGGISPSS